MIVKSTLFVFSLVLFGFSSLNAQLPLLDITNLKGKEIKVVKNAVIPMRVFPSENSFSHIAYDSSSYTAVFDSVFLATDSTYTIILTIRDYYKKIYADSLLLSSDSLSVYKLKYVTGLKGEYYNIMINESIAALEGYHEFENALHFDELDASTLALNQLLWMYRSGYRYKSIEEIKHKVFQELFWIHLFPGLTTHEEQCWQSHQAIYLDLKMKRIPSKLTLTEKGKSVFIHQEVDHVALYKGRVKPDELETIRNSSPDAFFFRISSDAEYVWNDKLNIPESISAKLTTTAKDPKGDWVRTDNYNITFIESKTSRRR